MSEHRPGGTSIQGHDERWRIFAAVPVNDAVRSVMIHAQDRLKRHGWHVRWVDPQLAHLTLRFYGDSDTRTVDSIRRHIEHVAGRHQSIRLQTGALGAFPSASRPRVLWLGLDGDASRLRTLAEDIGAGGDAGDPGGRQMFKPHITVARLRNGAQPPVDFAAAVRTLHLSAEELVADRVLLIRSVLGARGPAYTTIGEWPLTTRSSESPVHGTTELHEHG